MVKFFVLLFYTLTINIIHTSQQDVRKTPNFLTDEFIDTINRAQNMWKAGRNFRPDISLQYIYKIAGLNTYSSSLLRTKTYDQDFINSLPENFDSREAWKNCPSLDEIRDQGPCGSCWAVSSVEVMTDRNCIFSNGTNHFHFSTNDLIACCDDDLGCSGGLHDDAFRYWKTHGIVSGGHYSSNEGCRPYEIPPCEHHVTGLRPPCNSFHNITTPSCKTECQPKYNETYKKDKRYAKDIYSLNGEDDMKAELFKNGPITVGFEVYEDFLVYKKGVYKHKLGEWVGLHAVKILGWGVENGNKYWLVANSWNTDWGDKGFVKFLRGENHCMIERAVAGVPLLV